jgi:hypothetical protein
VTEQVGNRFYRSTLLDQPSGEGVTDGVGASDGKTEIGLFIIPVQCCSEVIIFGKRSLGRNACQKNFRKRRLSPVSLDVLQKSLGNVRIKREL